MFRKIDISDLNVSNPILNNKESGKTEEEFIFDKLTDKDDTNLVNTQTATKQKHKRADANNQEKGVNGEIDEPVYQGDVGDCWLLSAILSMSYNEDGVNIIKENMSINKDGSVDISFPGIDKEYSVSSSEIKEENVTGKYSSSEYSRGDDDMLALELGIDKVVKDTSVTTKYSLEEGGSPYYVYKLFDAESITVADSSLEVEQALDYFEENSDECSMSIAISDVEIDDLLPNHGYAVKSVEGDNVILVNPWDSTKEIKASKSDLIENGDKMNVIYAEFDPSGQYTDKESTTSKEEKFYTRFKK